MTDIVNIYKSVSMLFCLLSERYIIKWQNDKQKNIFHARIIHSIILPQITRMNTDDFLWDMEMNILHTDVIFEHE